MKKSKFYWHIHDRVLVESLTEPIENRIKYIREIKSKDESPEKIALRFRLMKPVKGELPIVVIKAEKAYNKAEKAYSKAWETFNKAWEAYNKAEKAYSKAWEVLIKAREAYNKAEKAYSKAWEVLIKAREASKEQVEALHAKECGCKFKKNIFDNLKSYGKQIKKTGRYR